MLRMLFHNFKPDYEVLADQEVYLQLEQGLEDKEKQWLKRKRDMLIDQWLGKHGEGIWV